MLISMHIYHYAAYETTARKRLICRYASREIEVDELLKNHVFVDLYTVVLDILLTLKGEDSYRVYTARLYGSPRWVPVAGGITAPLA
jgi:predicted RecB family nuclease